VEFSVLPSIRDWSSPAYNVNGGSVLFNYTIFVETGSSTGDI
jgi:hypothetical protein